MDKLALICVLYNPSQECIDKWRSYTEWMPNCIFIDNTPFPKCRGDKFGLNYISLHKNIGIAAAQNIGIRHAKLLGCEYIIFFDQDSKIDIELISQLKREFIDQQERGIKIAAIGPRIIDKDSGKAYKNALSRSTSLQKVNTIISSGTFTSISVIDEVGSFNENLFIDGVDHEWCWRAISKGYEIYQSYIAILYHKVGQRTSKFCGYPILISSSFRYFYQYRNFIWLAKLPYIPFNWKIKGSIRKFIECFIVPFKTPTPFKTFKEILKGIYCGIFHNL